MIRFQHRDVRRRMAGQRKDAAFQRAAEEGLAAVDRELGADGADLAEAEAHGSAARSFAVDRRGQAMRARDGTRPRGAHRGRARSPRRTSPRSVQETRLRRRRRPAACPGLAIASLEHACPGRPVALPIRPLTVTDRVATWGKTWRSATQTGGVAASSIRPAIPFQFPWVWSLTLCELTPTSTTRRLSTRIVSRCRPGMTVVPRSYSWGVDRLSCLPIGRSSSQTRVSMRAVRG